MKNKLRAENKNMFKSLNRNNSFKSLISVDSTPDIRIDSNLNQEIE